ncbi:Phage major capsid protein [Dehalobacter sp. UNSWDHB]|uniref:phage major capsid protein n=1 Tax=Dehalobacter sp. UNSWDHB TaxID=1339256 RepID=UPI00038757B6|nr:phage major capsid protein [Dehalobacter sp. UNSWDHB]EQB20039.1 Phage major capsid protein [Dehalobacter sp. UNSWDHB]
MRLAEIEARLAAIASEINTRGAQMTAEELSTLNTEVDALKTERAGILAAAEQRTNILASIAEGRSNTPATTVRTFTDPEHRAAAPANPRDTAEYRNAFLKRLMGMELTDAERRDLSSASGSVGVAIPTATQNEIIRKIKETAPLMDEITMLHVAGNVTFAVENSVAEVTGVHTENGSINASNDTLISISLAGYEIVKLVRISETVRTMSVNAFESWLVDMLSEKIALAIEYFIIKGSGTNQPKGVDALTYVDGTNGVDYAAAKPTAAEIAELISYLPSRHARKAKFLMHRSTLWTDIAPIRDDAKAPILRGDGADGYNIYGYPVMFSDNVDAGDIFFGNFKMVIGNLAQDVTVKASEHSGFTYNAIDYRGTAIFDCDIADTAAFVKGAATL